MKQKEPENNDMTVATIKEKERNSWKEKKISLTWKYVRRLNGIHFTVIAVENLKWDYRKNEKKSDLVSIYLQEYQG